MSGPGADFSEVILLETEQSRQIGILIFAAALLCALIIGYNAYYVPDAPLSQPSFSESASSAAEKLDLNTATAAQLAETLPGIGAEIAERIVSYREANGPFASVDDLKNVEGIGEKKLGQIRSFLVAG